MKVLDVMGKKEKTDFYPLNSVKYLNRWASQVAQWERICLPMQETQVPSLGEEDSLETEMATHSSMLAWEVSWTKEPGVLQSMGLQSQTQLSD